MKNMIIKRVKIAWYALFYTLAAAGMAAKVKKDIITHREHNEKGHNPCACGDQCLPCLLA